MPNPASRVRLGINAKDLLRLELRWVSKGR